MAANNGSKRPDGEDGEPPKSLQNFVTEEYERQRQAEGGRDAAGDVDDARMNQFFERAIRESSRMNKEVEKSKAKMTELQTELGAARMAAWQAEHAAEVLSPEQQQAIQEAKQILA